MATLRMEIVKVFILYTFLIIVIWVNLGLEQLCWIGLL